MFYVSEIAGEVVGATICSALMFRHSDLFRHRQGIHPYQLSLSKVRDSVRIRIGVHNISLKYDKKKKSHDRTIEMSFFLPRRVP